MKKMTLARALETQNRISNEIHCLWKGIQRENFRRQDKERSIDIPNPFMIIKLYTEKLVELKTKIDQASAGKLEAIHRLEEDKNRMAMLEAINADKEIDNMKIRLRLECNTLREEIEDYNARTMIDFDMPPSLEEWARLAIARRRTRE